MATKSRHATETIKLLQRIHCVAYFFRFIFRTLRLINELRVVGLNVYRLASQKICMHTSYIHERATFRDVSIKAIDFS